VRVVPGRKPAQEDAALASLKTTIETWAMQVLERPVRFAPVSAGSRPPWQHEIKAASVVVDGRTIGTITAVPLACRRAMDEHLSAWAVALGEIDLSAVRDLERPVLPLPKVPSHPQVDMDFSVLAPASQRYEDLAGTLAEFHHPLLVRLGFVDSYEGGSVPPGKRSLTFRVRVGHAERTLADNDLLDFRQAFLAYLGKCGLEIRG
jgi:phenylalanyl-tRNA synthetase beta chain